MPKQKSDSSYTVGIDLGGTKVAVALVSNQGNIITQCRKPTVPPEFAHHDPRSDSAEPKPNQVKKHVDYVVAAIADAVEEVLNSKVRGSLSGIGLASAGPMDLEKGTLEEPSNFRGWKVVPLVRLLKERLAKKKIRAPLKFQNDAMAAALGEGWVGQARGLNTFAMITVGTGIGTGVVLNGRPSQSSGMGSEWGHLLVDARGVSEDLSDYETRTVEGLASGTGLAHRAREAGLKIDSVAELAALARTGDSHAKRLFNEGAEALAALLYSLSLGYHPEKFVISGGMLAIRDCFLPETTRLYKSLMRARYPKFLAPVQIAKLGNDAGVIGAARLTLLSSDR